MLRAFSSNQMAKNNFPRTKARIACALSLAALFAFDAGGDGARAGFLEELFGLGAPQQAAQVPQPSGKSDRGRRAGRGSRIQSSLSYMPKARRHVAKNAGEKVAGVPNGKKGFCYADTAQTVEQIAYGLGFRDPAYFSRFFSRRVGMSPGAYRKAARLAPPPPPTAFAAWP